MPMSGRRAIVDLHGANAGRHRSVARAAEASARLHDPFATPRAADAVRR
jgi:hypothetical protein